jgi:hypothetical protein
MIELARRQYAFGTSHRLDEIEFQQANGSHITLLRKDLRRSELGLNALRAKPDFLYEPRRELEAYRILGDLGLGLPECFERGDDWLLLERVSGVELWQVGDLERWVAAARWIRDLHSRFVGYDDPSKALLRYDAQFFAIWPTRAGARHPDLRRLAKRYDDVIEILSAEPQTLIHGEFYASNILVAASRIAPVDWEMAGIGPGALDLAALISGWDGDSAAAIIAGYGEVSSAALNAARLHIAMQWLGWSDSWTPPSEHARDWVSEALYAAERLGI